MQRAKCGIAAALESLLPLRPLPLDATHRPGVGAGARPTVQIPVRVTTNNKRSTYSYEYGPRIHPQDAEMESLLLHCRIAHVSPLPGNLAIDPPSRNCNIGSTARLYRL